MNYMGMPPAMFYELIQRITPRIRKSERYRQPLEPELKLAIYLRYMYIVTNKSYKNLQRVFRVFHNTIALFILKKCQAIIHKYENEV